MRLYRDFLVLHRRRVRRGPGTAPPSLIAPALLLCGACLAVLLAGCGGSAGSAEATAATPTYVAGDGVGSQAPPPLTLTDQHGHRVDLAKLKAKPVLVAFLYTHCHDVCPIVASKLHTADALLRPGVERPTLLAVSVDPEARHAGQRRQVQPRTPHEGEIDWLLGSRPELEKVWKAWRVLPGTEPGNPDVIEHSGQISGIGADGMVHVLFTPTFKPAKLARDIETLAEA